MRPKASHVPAVLTYLLGKYPYPQRLTTTARMLYIQFRASSTERVDRRLLVDRFYLPLVSATARMDVYAVGTFIFGRIVINHVQYPL